MIDDEVAELMARSGGRTTSRSLRKRLGAARSLVKKKMSEEALIAAAAWRRVGARRIERDVLPGARLPHDTHQDLHESVRLARRLARLGVDDVALCAHFYPIPATELFDQLLERGRVHTSPTIT
ncbi:MAG: hypothetical protein U1E76_23485 [Planctomycetota bacterium]